MKGRTFLPVCAVMLGCLASARAVVFFSTGDISYNTQAPTGTYLNSGWQYEGRMGEFLGTVIGPQFFITAEHIGGSVGAQFFFNNQTYTTDAFYDDPNSDLRIWHVTTTFPTYALLYKKSDEIGKELVLFGRGPARGAEIVGKGWLWGTTNQEQRWGTNVVTNIANAGTPYGQMVEATFDPNPALPNEAMLSVGDSGGGLFIKDTDGVWKLAGVNFAVSGPYKNPNTGATFNASLYNQNGYDGQQFNGSYAPETGPGSLYATRISANLDFIHQVTGMPEPSTGAAIMAGFAMWAGCVRRRALGARR